MSWDRDKERKAGRAMTVGSSVFGIIFAVIWCIAAASMGAWFMLFFGIPFVVMMIYRLYACIQLTKAEEEKRPPQTTDPWERPAQQELGSSGNFCPYCGFALQDSFEYCPKCGRKRS